MNDVIVDILTRYEAGTLSVDIANLQLEKAGSKFYIISADSVITDAEQLATTGGVYAKTINGYGLVDMMVRNSDGSTCRKYKVKKVYVKDGVITDYVRRPDEWPVQIHIGRWTYNVELDLTIKDAI